MTTDNASRALAATITDHRTLDRVLVRQSRELLETLGYVRCEQVEIVVGVPVDESAVDERGDCFAPAAWFRFEGPSGLVNEVYRELVAVVSRVTAKARAGGPHQPLPHAADPCHPDPA